jgi:ABC-2 type transport system permease protein
MTPGRHLAQTNARMRLIARGWLIHSKHMSSTGFFIVFAAVNPVIYATIAFYVFRAGEHPSSLQYAAVGAGMLSLWHTTLVGSGQALTLLRTAGMLELLVVAPTPFVFVLAPMTLATASVGLYALASTMAWGSLLFGMPLHVESPLLLVAAVVSAVFSLGMLGMVLGSVFIRYRYANALTNVLVTPVWLLSGMLVPVALLPRWLQPVSWILPSRWGAQAIRDSVVGGQPVSAIVACLVLGVAYLGLGLLTLRTFEQLARRRASLALA